jgi:hypothetical protein
VGKLSVLRDEIAVAGRGFPIETRLLRRISKRSKLAHQGEKLAATKTNLSLWGRCQNWDSDSVVESRDTWRVVQ